jgi:hypothetical protein
LGVLQALHQENCAEPADFENQYPAIDSHSFNS